MALTIKALASGQLGASKATLYTVPGSTQTIIKSITLVNTDSVTRTVNLYINTAGTSRRVSPKDLSLPAGAMFELDRVITLEAADLIEGDASSAAVVDYAISGAENA
jgi:hypothetical protein